MIHRPCLDPDSRNLITTKPFLRQSGKFEYGCILENTRGLLIFFKYSNNIMVIWRKIFLEVHAKQVGVKLCLGFALKYFCKNNNNIEHISKYDKILIIAVSGYLGVYFILFTSCMFEIFSFESFKKGNGQKYSSTFLF